MIEIRTYMIDFFSLFESIISLILIFGGVMGFEILAFSQVIKYYKIGELIVGTRSQDMFLGENKNADFHSAIVFLVLGILFFILFTFVLTLVGGAAGIILPIFHCVIISTLVYWYWKKKTIEANLAEYNVDENQEITKS
jgi:hypothetical protein